MRHKKTLLRSSLTACVLLTAACATAGTTALSPGFVLVGSTPGHDEIKSILRIDQSKPIDFIRWRLSIDQPGRGYLLNITYGEGEPNTPGFNGGGDSRVIRGGYSVSRVSRGDIYKLAGDELGATLSLLKLTENTFHFLTGDNKLMIGTGGWSYTLNRKVPVANGPTAMTSWATGLLNDSSQAVIFDGRTPCVELGRPDLSAGSECRKLKWKLTLFRDPANNRPTTYKLVSTMNRTKPVEGTWTLVNGTHENPRALILQLDPDDPGRAISFLVGDENILFLLDKRYHLIAGNDDFGFTLNRRRQ